MVWEEEDQHWEGFAYFFFFFPNCRNEGEINMKGLKPIILP